MSLKKLKDFFRFLETTPIHPQWLINKSNDSISVFLKTISDNSTVLDIGCSSKWPKLHLPSSCYYIGLDYLKTAKYWYKTIPDLYADASLLPIDDCCIDIVLLIDVLEHLPDDEKSIKEIYRILKPNGKLLIQVPFIYPLHDEPYDFRRFTKYGLTFLANKHGFVVDAIIEKGTPIETAMLLLNLALSKTVINWINNKNFASVLLFVLPICILFNNIFAKLLLAVSYSDTMMPSSYQIIFKKSN